MRTSDTIEYQRIDLAMLQIEYDIRAVKVWMGKMKRIENHAFSLRLEARQKAAIANKRTATDFMSSHLTFLPMQRCDQVMEEISVAQRA